MLNTTQKRKILKRIQVLESDIEELKRCRTEIAKTGYASATISSAGGSKSYTRTDISKITEAINALTTELEYTRNLLGVSNGGNGLWKTILTIYQ